MSQSLNGLILNNARRSTHRHIIAESSVTKLFPVTLQDLTHTSKGSKSEFMFTVKTAKFTTGENVLLARCVIYIYIIIHQTRVQRTVFSPLKVMQSCPCTCHATTGGVEV